MKKHIVVCDRCRTELEVNAPFTHYKLERLNAGYEDGDLCAACALLLKTFLKGEPYEAQEAPGRDGD